MKPSHFILAFLAGGIVVGGLVGSWGLASLLLMFLIVAVATMGMRSVMLPPQPGRTGPAEHAPLRPGRQEPKQRTDDPAP